MFLCEPCLSKHYRNGPSSMQSHGPCESCKVTTTCSDIIFRDLHPKPKHPEHKWELDKAHGQADYIMSLKGGYIWTCRTCNCRGESHVMHRQPVSSTPCKATAAEKARNKIRTEASAKGISHLDVMENLLGDDDES